MPEPEKKKHGWKVLLALGGIAYFFIAAKPLQREFSMAPIWALDLGKDVAAASPMPDAKRPFTLGKRFGYYSEDGRMLKSALAKDQAALSSSLWAEFSGDADEIAFSSPEGKRVFSLSDPGRPFFESDRLFVSSPDANGIAEYSAAGAALWSRDISAIATCFDANRDCVAVGGLEGRLIVLSADGSLLCDYSPGGSRIPIILGCSLSADSSMVALVSGIDRQRFIILEKKGDSYRLAYHAYLDTDFRRRVFVDFSADGRYVFVEGDSAIRVHDIKTGKTARLPLAGRLMAVRSSAQDDRLLILSTGQGQGRIQVVRGLSAILFDSALPGSDLFLEREGSSVFLGCQDHVMRIDMGNR
jgi:hypothetical protein